ncbi:S41 family peptidase [Psychroflexus montanilacus]|uniref:S41 family peptidase n=1 Tax=Psychroflexus montanilacus TaxID=2873598 RepID=UPI001CCB6657|nr:S41 family peptidase [Psychroflexus montanilacus]MBZ9650636.1 PDZ domain-containing protein [Psychroflexus montanilacus]
MKRFYLLLVLTFISIEGFSQGTMLLRQPTISSDYVVFVYANDLWKVPHTGGEAERLTTYEGYESLPHFSNDGKWIAFSAEYDGNTDVYVIPVEGGTPRRLTFHPGGDFVQGWTPEGDILFRSGRKSHPTKTAQLYTVSVKGSFPEPLIDVRAAYGDVSPDGNYLAYTPITSWDPEWRNYRGGQAMPIWILDLKNQELVRTPQTDKERHLEPVWIGEKIYYLSERDYSSNIWSYDIQTKQEKQITFHKKFDVKSLDTHGDHIIYEQGGYLHLFSTNDKSAQQLEINVAGDLNFSRERWDDVKSGNVLNPNLSPNGKRAIFEYRGDIFTIPKEEGSWRNITQSSGVADRFPIWSPKGDKIAWFSDASGEYELVVSNQYGENKTFFKLDNPTFYFTPDWSPDGKFISYTDTDYNLWFINLENAKVKKVDTDGFAHPNRTMNPNWSPDSRYITYEKQQDSHFKSIFIYDTQTGKTNQISDPLADAISPVWDKSGKYLYFLASTDYGLNTGWLDMSSYDASVNRSLYAVVLDADGEAPNLPKSDNEEGDKTNDKDEKSKKDKINNDDEQKVKPIKIDFDGIQSRVVALQLPARDYQFIKTSDANKLFIAESVLHKDGLKVHNYDVEKEEAEDYEEEISQMVLSKNGDYTLYQKGGQWTITDTKSKAKPEDKLSVSAKMLVDPKAEYAQIFKEGWRFMRDFLYVDNVHGAPWNEVYNWYVPWLDHVNHRTDLNYLVDILSGEVSIGHSYVSGGDMPDVDRVPVGLLGADFEIEDGHYKITKIYDGEQWNPDISAPLGLTGQKVKEGDFVLEVNGKSLSAENNIYKHFAQTSGRTVSLLVNTSPSKSEAKKVYVKPVSNENGLRYIDWVESNRRKVDEMSDGKLAYVYIPNTSQPGFTSFNRYYFSQQDKKGVVLDERNNGGGSAADYMIDIMTREPIGYFNSKAGDNKPWTSPLAGIWGPKVMIINERAGSGGDLLPYIFKKKEIGPLVGTRTWGGLVGTWDTPRFIDGGRMVAPRGGFYDTDGEWAVEGEGVSPDFEVIDEPKLSIQGRDAQLEKAVEEALKLLETEEFQMQPEPEAPKRWKRPEGYDKK